MTARPRRAIQVILLTCAGISVLWAVSMVRVTTRQGVNFQLSVTSVPLYAKAIAFLHRHVEYGLLAKDITRGLRSQPERVRAIYAWTRGHIRPTPADWPIVDDHVLNIIIRGHGSNDQMADAFTTLAAYAGLPAFYRQGPIIVSFVRVDGRWAMFDVANGLVFADASGQFLDAAELLSHPELADPVIGSLAVGGEPYRRQLERLAAFWQPVVRRPDLQMPLPRLVFELRRALRLPSAAPPAPGPA